MSKVTIKELYWELNNEELREANKLWDEANEIEIVPRKIVELIIGKCIELEWKNGGDMNDEPIQFGKSCAARDIAEFAESLLTEFETGGITNE